ncbi:hypothetical protein HYT45_04260 [Candidatus Uhrbacteria bacterium]|nr:hypothetical protein [Candidatus Uhrbacteria bacterium]
MTNKSKQARGQAQGWEVTMIITLTGSSGAGKTTYCRELLGRKPNWKLVPSYTSRAPRQKDLPGEYVYNVGPEEFGRMATNNETVWQINEHGNTYATLRRDVEDAAKSPDVRLMLLAPDAVEILRETFAREEIMHFYLLSPPEAELRKRLARRNLPEEEIERRISDCKDWDHEIQWFEMTRYRFIPGDIKINDAVDLLLRDYELHCYFQRREPT